MTQLKTKEPVRLRRKALADGNISLYLDIYINGRREYEFLKMYLVPEKNKEDRDRNKETMRLAEAIKALRIVDIQKGRYGFNNKSREVLFYDNKGQYLYFRRKGTWYQGYKMRRVAESRNP